MDVSLDSTVAKKSKRRRITELASNFLFTNSSVSKLSSGLQRSFGGAANSSISMIDEEDDTDAGTLKKR